MKRRTHKRTMAELRWIQTCLSLILGLQVTAVTGQSSSPPPSSPSITVRAGDDVTLSCTKVIDGQHECNSTDWYFSGSTDTKLVGGGRIVVEDKSKSDRLRVSETCALVLKNVSAEDAGRFECQQISSGKRYHYTHVFLSVVSMTEQEVGEDVTLTCSVSSYGDCKDKVRWLFKGNPVDKGHRELKTSQSGCSATVSFLKTHFSSNDLDNFKCEVMNSSSENKQQFTFSPCSSGKKGSSSGDKETTSDKTTAGPGQGSLIFRLGGAATLPCGNIRGHQVKCKGTTWSFSSGSRAVELFARGQIGERVQDRSDRLSLTENCALVLKKVSRDDVGQYGCRQVDTSGRQQGQESVFHLSAFNMTEEKNGDMVQLYCSVLKDGKCLHSVKWLYEGPQSHNIDTRSHDCSASVAFNLSDLHNKSNYKKFFKCEVTNRNSGEVQEFTFSPEASRETDTATAGPGGDGATAGPGGDGATAGPGGDGATAEIGGDGATAGPGGGAWWVYVVVAVGLAMLLIIIVALIRKKKSEGNKTQTHDRTRLSLNPAQTESAPQTSQDMADPEDGVAYASVSYTKTTRSPAQVQSKDDDDDDGTVTYSTMKSPSSGPSDVYATVNKPDKSNTVE